MFSFFAAVVALVALVVAFVLGVPFVFAALIVSAACTVFTVAVVPRVIKHKNKEASREAKSIESRKAKTYTKQTDKKHKIKTS